MKLGIFRFRRAGELVNWAKARMPVRQGVFLTHGEESRLNGLWRGLSGWLLADRIVIPLKDDAFELNSDGFTGRSQCPAAGAYVMVLSKLDVRFCHDVDPRVDLVFTISQKLSTTIHHGQGRGAKQNSPSNRAIKCRPFLDVEAVEIEPVPMPL